MKCYMCNEKLTKKEIEIRNLLKKSDIEYVVINGIQYTGYGGGMPFCYNCAKTSYQTHAQRLGESK